MASEGPRLLTYWATRCGVAPNTIRNWARLPPHPLPTQVSGSHQLIAEVDFRTWLDAHRYLPAAGRALHCLDRVTIDGEPTTPKPGDLNPLVAAPSSDNERDEVRAFRARIATLDDQLDAERKQSEFLRVDRDQWRAAARAHRESLRAQLYLEDARDLDIAGSD